MGKLKYFLYILCGIFSFSLIFCHDTFAIDYDTNKLGAFLIDADKSYVLKSDGSTLNFKYGDAFTYPGVNLSTTLKIAELHIKTDRIIPANSMLNFYYSATSWGNSTPFIIKAYGGKAYLYETEYLTEVTYYPNNTTNVGVNRANMVNIKMITTVDTDEFIFAFDEAPTGFMQIVPGSYIGLVNTSQDMKDIENSVNQGNQNAQDRFDKEQEQREEDKKASEDASNNSQSSSDDSQKQADDASKNLFQVLTEFVSAISGASASSCSITGDFGFFNVGSIDLCTGASKIQPITTVIGTVMLIGLCIPAVVTLLHRFVSLYNEVMS